MATRPLKLLAAALPVLVAATLLAPVPARAATNEEYTLCDGYPAPDDRDDGVTGEVVSTPFAKGLAEALIAWRPPEDPGGRERVDISATVGQTGLNACNAALGDSRILPPIWQRKVSLLRARAIHRLALKADPAEALADLDLADAAALSPDAPYYRRSLGLGVAVTRAFALRLKGDQAKAEAVALDALARRPFGRFAAISAREAIGPHAGAAAAEAVDEALARVDPFALDAVFQQAFDTGRFEDAAALYPQLVPPETYAPEGWNSWKVDQAGIAERNRLGTEQFWVFRAGQAAYALAALGRTQAARDMIAAARTRLAAATAPPPALDRPSAQAGAQRQLALLDNADLAARGSATLDAWARLAELRALVAQGEVKAAVTAIFAHDLQASGFASEFVGATLDRLPPELSGLRPQLLAIQAKLAAIPRHRGEDDDPALLFRDLPDAEGAHAATPYKRSSLMGEMVQGFRAGGFTDSPDGPDAMEVSYENHLSSRAVVDEMSLLHAADLARRRGARGFVVRASKDVHMIDNTIYYGRVVSTKHSGYRSFLNVAFVDPAALPAEYRKTPWRVLDADAVWASLAPIYLAPPAS